MFKFSWRHCWDSQGNLWDYWVFFLSGQKPEKQWVSPFNFLGETTVPLKPFHLWCFFPMGRHLRELFAEDEVSGFVLISSCIRALGDAPAVSQPNVSQTAEPGALGGLTYCLQSISRGYLHSDFIEQQQCHYNDPDGETRPETHLPVLQCYSFNVVRELETHRLCSKT